MTLSLGITDLLMLVLVVQGFLLSGLLLSTSKKIRSNRWIGALIFVISLQILQPQLDQLHVIAQYPWLLYILFSVNFVFGPLIYLYAHALIFGDDKLSVKKYLVFLPLVLDMKRQFIFLLYITGALAIPVVQNFYFLGSVQHFLFGPDGIIKVLMAVISTVVYSVLSYRMIVAYAAGAELSTYKLADLMWLKKLLRLMFVLLVLWLALILINAWLPVYNWLWNYLLSVPVLIFVYWLGMSAYLRQSKMSVDEVEDYNHPPAKVYLSDTDAARYQQRLLLLMETEKLYLDPLIKLEELSAKLGISEKQTSYLLNRYIGQNFNDLINSYRVEEAKKRLIDPANAQFTIASIAFDCGFNSLATFQRCFKQLTGTTPSKYQSSNNLPSLQINSTHIRI